MYNKSILKLDTPTAKEIGFTSDFFESGTIWKRLPYGFYISRLEPKTQNAVEQMLSKISKKGFLISYVTPGLHQEYIKEVLDKFGYVKRTDSAGSVFYENFTKSSSGKVQRLKPTQSLQTI